MAALSGGQLKRSRWWNPHSMQLPLLSQDDFFLQPRPDRLPHLSSCPPTRDGPAVPRAAPRRSSGTKTTHWVPTRRYPLSFHPCVSSSGFRTDCGRIIDLKWTNIWRVSRQKLLLHLLLFLLLLLGSTCPVWFILALAGGQKMPLLLMLDIQWWKKVFGHAMYLM